MEANRSALGGRPVLRPGRAVGKNHHLVSGFSAAPVPDFFHAPAQTLLGQQTDNEIGIGLAVLDAVTARPGGRSEAVAREEGTHFATALPGSQWRVVRQHRLEYFQHRHVLEYTAVATLRQQPGPWHQPQAVTGQPA